MWLLVSLVAAVISTILYLVLGRRYRTGALSLMLWGLTLMVLVDHLILYEGGPFLEVQTTGMVRSSVLLGLLMVLPLIGIWATLLAYDKIKTKRLGVN